MSINSTENKVRIRWLSQWRTSLVIQISRVRVPLQNFPTFTDI